MMKTKTEERESKDNFTDEDNNIKYFLKTPDLKDKLIRKSESPVESVEKVEKPLELKEEPKVETVEKPLSEGVKEEKLLELKEEPKVEMVKKPLEVKEEPAIKKDPDVEKVEKQKLIDDREKLAHEYEEKLKIKLQEALLEQKKTLEVQLKKQFEHRERELNQKIEDGRGAFELREKKLKEFNNKKQNSFSKIQKDLQKRLLSQDKLELSKSELSKSKKEIQLKLEELSDLERDFQVLKDKKEDSLELKRRDLDSRFDYYRDKEKEEFEKEKMKIIQEIRGHVSKEFHDKLNAAEEKLRVHFENNSSEKIEKSRVLMDNEISAIKEGEQKLMEENNQKQISLDQARAELEKRSLALKRMGELDESEITELKNQINNLSTTLKEKEDEFGRVRDSLKSREQKLIEEDNQKQISLDQIKVELNKGNLALERTTKLSMEQAERLNAEINNLSTTLKEKEDEFGRVRDSLKSREQKLIEEDNQKQISLDRTKMELDKKNMELIRTSEFGREQVERSRIDINNLSTTLKEKEKEFARERNKLKQNEQKLIMEYKQKQISLNKLQEELQSKILISEMAEKLGKNKIEKLEDQIENKDMALEEKQREIEIEMIKKQKDLEIGRKDLEIKFENFKNLENEKFNAKMITARRSIFENAHKTLSIKFNNDLRIKEENLKKQMEERIKVLKKDLKIQSDIEVNEGINEKIELLEENLRSQIIQLESRKRN